MTRNTYAEHLTQKLSDVNEKLSASINTELSRLKDDENYLQSALESKSRQDLISHIENDLELERLSNSLSLGKSISSLSTARSNQELIQHLERDLEIEKLKQLNKTLEANLLRSSLSSRPESASDTNHNFVNYLERDLAIEKQKILSESMNLKSKLLSSQLNRSTNVGTAALREHFLRQSLANDSLRSHFLVHKPGEECSICSPNNVYINTLKHSTNNLRTFLKNSIDENKDFVGVQKVAPNVVNILFQFY